jgi:hypothetical protein
MTYKSYPTKATTPQRMARKRTRRDVFVFNRRAAKLRRKEARIARQTLVEENENRSE